MGEDPVLSHIQARGHVELAGSLGTFEAQARTIVQAMGRVKDWWGRTPRDAYYEVALKLLRKGFTVIEVTAMLQELRTAAHGECGE